LEKDKRMKGPDKEMAAKSLLNMELPELERLILEKMKVQWKTIRKAFGSLNMEKTGSISKGELGYFLDFWGIHISQENFDKIYSRFDIDGDGVISYKDF
jgi:Ca2+-binding EF-hand superfamily protein